MLFELLLIMVYTSMDHNVDLGQVSVSSRGVDTFHQTPIKDTFLRRARVVDAPVLIKLQMRRRASMRIS